MLETISASDTEITVRFCLALSEIESGAFAGLQGHFPGTPIIPAFLQLTWISQWLQRAWRIDVQRVVRAKFSRPILPEDVYVVIISREAPNNAASRKNTSIKFEIRQDNVDKKLLCSSGLLIQRDAL